MRVKLRVARVEYVAYRGQPKYYRKYMGLRITSGKPEVAKPMKHALRRCHGVG
jgi:hypothetical protein